MLVAGVTPLHKTNEIHHWDNQPFYRKNTEDVETAVKKDKIKKIIKKKRSRTYFSTEQLRELEKVFSKQRYISSLEREELVKSLGINSKTLKVWFQNRRMKEKKSESNSDYEDSDVDIMTVRSTIRKSSNKKRVPMNQQDQLSSSDQVINPERYEIHNQFQQYQPQIDVSNMNYSIPSIDHLNDFPYPVQSYAYPIPEAPNEFNSFYPFYHEQFYPQTFIMDTRMNWKPNNDFTQTAAGTTYSPSIIPTSEYPMISHPQTRTEPRSISSVSEPNSEIRSNWCNFNIGEFLNFV